MTTPKTAAGQALLDVIRQAVLPPELATLLTTEGKQALVALVSVELLEKDIAAIEQEAAEPYLRVVEAAREWAAAEQDTAEEMWAAAKLIEALDAKEADRGC